MAGTPVVASPQFGVGNQTDVFAIKNGQLTVSWVNGPGAWQGPVGLGPAGIFPSRAALAASPQYGVPNQTDVFAMSNNGQLQVFWVNSGGAWHGPVGLGPVSAFPPGTALAASNQFGVPNQTDVFAINDNGQLNVFWVNGGGIWNGPVGLGPVRAFPAGAALATSPQYGVPNQTDVFAVGNNGQLQVFWVEGGGAWRGPAGLGPVNAFPPGAAVTASPQYGVPNQTDVFAVGNNGQLQVFWVDGGGAWRGPVGLGPVNAFPPGASVAASNQFGVPNQTDVFVIGDNGQLNVFWVNGGGNWNGPVGLGPVRNFPPGAALAASNQFGVPNQTDVFAVGTDDLLNIFWVNGGGAWQGPVERPLVLGPPPRISLRALQDAQGRFVEVDGISFTSNKRVHLDYDLFSGGAPDTHETGGQDTTADNGGGFASRIRVNLSSIAGATVKATDTISGQSATGSL